MLIREFSIDRFGILTSQRVPELSPGITIFFGENEAGKSTCLNFFRAMLFGYARNRKSIDYLADAKALSGGSLLMDSESLGRVRLARVPGPHGGKATLTDADGAPRPESDLAVMLRGCTPDLFDKVFAFSLEELMHFGSLTDDSIRHALHGAAFGTGLRSPGQVLKQLEDAMRHLYAPRASSAIIHGLVRELEAVNGTIKDRGNEVDRYAALRMDLEAATRELEASGAA
ncbi:MAG: AAA family ATPase, partial [Deltaproteobacteria bacterium]|nr:AAA family ATPase [Deltaproteobacteria bacterium]